MSIAYVSQWGVRGDGPGQLDQPVSIATDAVGDAYIADAGSRFIEKFDPQGAPLFAFQELNLQHPEAITVDAGGAIYVTDSGRGSATVFLPNGNRMRELRVRARPDVEDMLDVSVDDDGFIHILDANAQRVFTYTSRFRLLRTWMPAAGGEARPRAKAIVDGPDGYLYLADPAANRILRFTDQGHFAADINAGSGASERKLSDQIAVTKGYIFVMDVDGRMLHVWSTDGQPKLDVDLAPELGQGSRAVPALAVSPRRELLVLDEPEARVLRYKLNF